jgi:general secretion pathway protein C
MDKAQIITYWHEMPWNEIKLKANEHLPKFVFVLLILLLTQTVAKLTWGFFTPAQTSLSVIKKQVGVQGNVLIAKASLHKVAAYHLFGDALKQTVVSNKIIDAPETRLRLDLKGVFASSVAANALAIISSSKGKDKSYHIGEKIIGGAILHAVYADRVILKRQGKLETLRLPKSKLDSKAFYSASPTSQNTSRSPRLNQNQTRRLRKIRDTLLKEPAKVWQQVRVNPVMKNGVIHGYTLAHNDRSLMKALHIKKTDVITGINGKSLSDPATLYGLMNSLAGQKSLELTIERKGREQTLRLNF